MNAPVRYIILAAFVVASITSLPAIAQDARSILKKSVGVYKHLKSFSANINTAMRAGDTKFLSKMEIRFSGKQSYTKVTTKVDDAEHYVVIVDDGTAQYMRTEKDPFSRIEATNNQKKIDFVNIVQTALSLKRPLKLLPQTKVHGKSSYVIEGIAPEGTGRYYINKQSSQIMMVEVIVDKHVLMTVDVVNQQINPKIDTKVFDH